MTTLEFDRLVRQYQGLVYTVCHQLVPDVGEAQDLTQETFLAAWRSIDRCPPGFEKQWLARIASNKAKDYLRSAWVRRVNTPGDEVLALEGAPPESDPEQQVLETLGEEELTRRILALREPYKTPCRLMLLEQHTAVLALSLWRSGAITAMLGRGCDLKTILPSQTMSTPPQELTGKPMETRQEFYHRLSGVLENLLPGKTPDAGAIPTTPKQSVT